MRRLLGGIGLAVIAYILVNSGNVTTLYKNGTGRLGYLLRGNKCAGITTRYTCYAIIAVNNGMVTLVAILLV